MPGQIGVAAGEQDIQRAARRFYQLVHTRQLVIKQLVIIPHLQQLRVGDLQHVRHIAIAARFVDERAVPCHHHQVVPIVGKALPQQVAPGTIGQCTLLTRQQRHQVDLILQ